MATTKTAEILFVDTNILLAATDTSCGDHDKAVALLTSPDVRLTTSGQVLREYLVVATRPFEANGLGMTRVDACRNVDQFLARMNLLEETEAVSRMLHRLVQYHRLSGKKIHDANIAATMITHGLKTVVTRTPKDFKVFENFSAVCP